MDSVCVQLDDNVLQIFQVLEDLYTEQDKLEQLMKDGFLGISRSRYLLGMKWVSADQIRDADIAARYTTVVDHSVAPGVSTSSSMDDSAKASDIDKLTVFKLIDAMSDVCIDKKKEDGSDILTDANTDRQKGLRKRHTDNDQTRHKSLPEDDKADNEAYSSKISKKHDDIPDVNIKKEGSSKTLSLFGVLAPQPLRASQKCFEEAVKIAVNLVDLKLKLLSLQSEHRRLIKVKESVSDEQ